MIYDLAIIGGGASGLCLASETIKKGKNILLFEKEEKIGSKILVTGNGKCNLSATDVCPEKYNVPSFVENIIKEEDIITFLRSVGIMTRQIEQRIYPYSESALTVVHCLRSCLNNLLVQYEKVNIIEKKENYFLINKKYQAKKIALCTGSNATKGTNSHALFMPFGHTISPLVPALTPLKTNTNYIKGLSGLRAKVSLSLLKKGLKIHTETGEILFRDNGISGIVSMSISSFIARNNDKFDISCDFIPDKTEQEIIDFLQYGTISGIVHKSIAQAVETYARKNKIPAEKALKNFVLTDVETGTEQQAQVMHGGLNVDEFSEITLESKKQKGLFACGEVLDVDGECGGYNLHWAFASALRVAKSI